MILKTDPINVLCRSCLKLSDFLQQIRYNIFRYSRDFITIKF